MIYVYNHICQIPNKTATLIGRNDCTAIMLAAPNVSGATEVMGVAVAVAVESVAKVICDVVGTVRIPDVLVEMGLLSRPSTL